MLFSAITQKLKCQIPIPDGFLLTLTLRRPLFSSPKCGSGAPRVALCQRSRLPMHEALEMQVALPGSGGPPRGGNGSHSSIPSWKPHAQRSLAGCSPWGHKS